MRFSNDSTAVVTSISWSSWTSTEAVGNGTWAYDDCIPDCNTATSTPYPATITLSQPMNGVFTSMTETTSGPEGFSSTYTYPSNWVLGAS
ncbi:MAG TPA: hypothetical protein VNV87_01800 [Acidimicrobiales bacterium]|nr:hypothetical protein [Acidimicrobiales bacterium]